MYTTSSQTFKSFGGGNNAGVSMSGGSLVATNNYAQTSSAVSISSPIGYTSLARNMANPQDALANGLSSEAVIASSMAMSTNGQLFGSYYTNDFSSSIDSYNPGSYGGIGYSSINNRQNLGEGMGSTYDDWLRWFDQVGWSYGTDTGGGNYTFDNEQAEAAYLAWVSSRSPELPVPSYPEWLSWLMSQTSHTGDGKTYSFVPVGNFLPLLFLALLYFVFISLKPLKAARTLNKE